jgi:hypothetical protein
MTESHFSTARFRGKAQVQIRKQFGHANLFARQYCLSRLATKWAILSKTTYEYLALKSNRNISFQEKRQFLAKTFQNRP